MKDANRWKASWERMEDRGTQPPFEKFISDIQQDAVKHTLKTAKALLKLELSRILDKVPRSVHAAVNKVMSFKHSW